MGVLEKESRPSWRRPCPQRRVTSARPQGQQLGPWIKANLNLDPLIYKAGILLPWGHAPAKTAHCRKFVCSRARGSRPFSDLRPSAIPSTKWRGYFPPTSAMGSRGPNTKCQREGGPGAAG